MPHSKPVEEIDPNLVYHLQAAATEKQSKAAAWRAWCGGKARTSPYRAMVKATEHDYLHICSGCLDRMVKDGKDSTFVYLYRDSDRQPQEGELE